MIFLGNKQDLDALQQRLVLKEDVAEWVFCELPKLRTKVSAALSVKHVTRVLANAPQALRCCSKWNDYSYFDDDYSRDKRRWCKRREAITTETKTTVTADFDFDC